MPSPNSPALIVSEISAFIRKRGISNSPLYYKFVICKRSLPIHKKLGQCSSVHFITALQQQDYSMSKYPFAFLDEGSSVTLIDTSLFDKLGIKGTTSSICLHWTGE